MAANLPSSNEPGKFDYTDWAGRLTHGAHEQAQYEIAQRADHGRRSNFYRRSAKWSAPATVKSFVQKSACLVRTSDF
jgi:hypothetical protein